MTGNPFGQERDAALGALLREVLGENNAADFVARVQSRLEHEPQDSVFDALARWSLPGLAAAAVLLVSLGAWWSQTNTEAGPGTPAEQLVADVSLDRSTALALVLEDR